MKEAGAWFQRMWNANRWFANRELPGEGRTWTQRGWEDTQTGYMFWHNWMSPPSGLEPDCDTLVFEISPHTVQTVTVMTRAAKKEAHE